MFSSLSVSHGWSFGKLIQTQGLNDPYGTKHSLSTAAIFLHITFFSSFSVYFIPSILLLASLCDRGLQPSLLSTSARPALLPLFLVLYQSSSLFPSLIVYMCPFLVLPCCPSLPPCVSSLIFINHSISLLFDPSLHDGADAQLPSKSGWITKTNSCC